MKVQCDFCSKTADASKQLDKNSDWWWYYDVPYFDEYDFAVCLCSACAKEYDNDDMTKQEVIDYVTRSLEDFKKCPGCGDWGAPQGCAVCGIECMGG